MVRIKSIILAVCALLAMSAPAMAVITTQQSSVTVSGNGATTAFNYGFMIPASNAVVVTLLNTTVTPNISTTVSAGQYNISGLNNPAGGSVTYPLSGTPLQSGYYLTISRVLPLIQTISISNQGAFYPSVVGSGLDYDMMALQQIQTQVTNLQNQVNSGSILPVVAGPGGRFINTGCSDTAGVGDTFIGWQSASSCVKAEALPSCGSGNINQDIEISDAAGTSGNAGNYVQITATAGNTIGNAGTGGASLIFYISSNGASQKLRCNGVGNWIVH